MMKRRLFSRATGAVALLLAAALLGGADIAKPSTQRAACAGRDVQAAISACTALLSNPAVAASDRAKILTDRATAYLDAKDLKAARADATKALETDPSFAQAYNIRGLVRWRARDLDGALKDLSEAIRLDPRHVWAYYNRGCILQERGDPRAAIADYSQSIRLDPTVWIPRFNRGNAYRDLGELDAALADYNETLRLRPDFVRAYVARGLVYGRKGRSDLEAQDFEAAIAANKLRPEEAVGYAYANRGVRAAQRGEYDRAIPDYDLALKTLPKDAQIFANRGVAHDETGNDEAAVADFEQALALDPTLTYARARLATLKAVRAAAEARVSQVAVPGKRVALVIGNGAYSGLSPLGNSVGDAQAVSQALRDLGYIVVEHHDVRSADFPRIIEQFEQNFASTAEVALIWYAGHGQSLRINGAEDKLALPSDNFVLPTDFQTRDDPSVKGITLGRLMAAVLPASKLRIVIIDACRTGAVSQGRTGFSGNDAVRSTANGISPLQRDILVVYSTQRGALAWEGPPGGRSPFAQAFLETATVDQARAVDVRLLFGGIAARTRELAGARGTSQLPQLVWGLNTLETLPLAGPL